MQLRPYRIREPVVLAPVGINSPEHGADHAWVAARFAQFVFRARRCFPANNEVIVQYAQRQWLNPYRRLNTLMRTLATDPPVLWLLKPATLL